MRNQQERIRSRLHDLQSMSQIKQELASTHLESEEERKVKKEEDERDGRGEMEGVVEDGPAEEAISPSAKRRIAAQVLVRVVPLSLDCVPADSVPTQSNAPNSLSLEESMSLQRQAAERARKAAERREQKMELDAKRPEKTGELLKGALGVDSALSNYMYVPFCRSLRLALTNGFRCQVPRRLGRLARRRGHRRLAERRAARGERRAE